MDILGQDAGRLRMEAAKGGLLNRGEGGHRVAAAQVLQVAAVCGSGRSWTGVEIISLLYKQILGKIQKIEPCRRIRRVFTHIFKIKLDFTGIL